VWIGFAIVAVSFFCIGLAVGYRSGWRDAGAYAEREWKLLVHKAKLHREEGRGER